MSHSGRPPSVHLVTQAHRSLSDDIAYRQRRYLLMMGIRAVCFVIAVVLFVNHFGWLTEDMLKPSTRTGGMAARLK